MASSHESHIAAHLRRCLPQHHILVPDTSIDPDETMALVTRMIHDEHIDLIIGHSLGGFIAQKFTGVKKVLINPSLGMCYMYLFIGTNRYKHRRHDGVQTFSVTRDLCHRYRRMQAAQYEHLDSDMTIGLFARYDLFTRLSAFRFSKHYTDRRFISGMHYPSLRTVRDEIAPVVEELLRRQD